MRKAKTPHKSASLMRNESVSLTQHEFAYAQGCVTLILDQQGICWVSLPNACQLLGLNARGQQQRISRTPELAAGLHLFTLSTRGGPQRVNCLQTELLVRWVETLKNSRQEIYAPFLQACSEAAATLREHNQIVSPCVSNSVQPPSHVEEEEEIVAQQLLLPLDKTNITPQGEAVVAAALPGLGQMLVVTNYPEDRAIREATLAKATAWQQEPTRRHPYYIASNEVRVSLGDPTRQLVIEDIQAALFDLRESTILTARYVLGRWHMAREQNSLAKEGSVFIQAEEILEWRGIVPHSRAIYPGSEIRQIDGYEQKYLDQVHQDMKLLELFHLQGHHRLLARGQVHTLTIDGPYLRTTQIQEPESGLTAYFIAPGGWINVWIAATEAYGGLWVAELDRRIFKLHPHNDQIALRLALFLTEHWQMHLAAGLDVVPLRMEDLLTASMVAIDRANLTLRFAPRVEAAIEKLVEQGIIGQAYPQQPLLKQGYWGKAWLAMMWEITPPAEVVKRYSETNRDRQSLPLLLPSPTIRSFEKSPLRTRRRKKEDGSIF